MAAVTPTKPQSTSTSTSTTPTSTSTTPTRNKAGTCAGPCGLRFSLATLDKYEHGGVKTHMCKKCHDEFVSNATPTLPCAGTCGKSYTLRTLSKYEHNGVKTNRCKACHDEFVTKGLTKTQASTEDVNCLTCSEPTNSKTIKKYHGNCHPCIMNFLEKHFNGKPLKL